MSENPQLIRYKKLLDFIDGNLNQDISIPVIEEICHYSYRNINRIFQAIHGETIGKYIKRLRLEKGAEYLRYSDIGVSQIAYQVGFEDRSAFSKAFRQKFKCSPKAFRNNSEELLKEQKRAFEINTGPPREPLKFEIEYLPEFHCLFNEYRGHSNDYHAIEKKWDELFDYASKHGLFSEHSIFMTEIIDDADISDHINSRYHQSLLLEEPLDQDPSGLFRTKKHSRQKYAKFVHQGDQESCAAYYDEIYVFWMTEVSMELVDAPVLEFYPNFDENLPESELITEIYIPVQ